MIKIAIIDPSAISRSLLTTLLTNGGHDVVGDSNTSPAGLTRILKLKPQVICIDIGNPADGGLAMLDTIREALPKTLIFLVSSELSSDTVTAAVAIGVHGFIVKPYNAERVLSTIRNVVIKIARQQKKSNETTEQTSEP
jgi:two-component system chemotaxis response regulator CheY